MKLRDLFPSFARKASDNATLELFREIFGSRVSMSGQTVTLTDALRCATVFACARVIANGIAQVPLKLFREDEATGKKTPARDHPLYRVLHRKPNPWQTSFEFRELIGLHLVLAGRAYAYKVMVGGAIRELIPLEPGKVNAKLADDGITVLYEVTGKDGSVRTFDGSMIWHLKGPSWNGWQGLDALDLAREAIGLSIASEASQSKLHKNGVRPSGTYSVDGTLNAEQHKALRKFLADNYAGENSGLPMVLDRSAKWLSHAMTGVDAQHLETRRFQVEEVCRSMGVMPIMVFSSDKATTYGSAEAMFEAHVVHTLAAWWERLEQSIDCNLLSEADDRAGVYAKFLGAGLARGSLKDRAEYYAKALGSGGSPAWMSPDEVRSLEELNPMGGAAALLPVATNVPAVDPVQAAKSDGMLVTLSEIKGQLQAHSSQPAMPPAAPTINVAAPPVNFTSYAQPDMEPIVAMMRKSLEGMAETLARSMSVAVQKGISGAPAPVINVKSADQLPPVVNVTNDVVVQPAAVELTLDIPPRKTTTDVTYDDDGNILRTVAVERDA